MTCAGCGNPFTPSGRRRYCSNACRQAAYRRRADHPVLPEQAPVARNIYECPSCETRYLGERRCSDCNQFCRRLGPGGPCPHCDEPVSITDIIPSLARPTSATYP